MGELVDEVLVSLLFTGGSNLRIVGGDPSLVEEVFGNFKLVGKGSIAD